MATAGRRVTGKIAETHATVTAEKLETAIPYHRKLYEKGTPAIDDAAFDELVEQLRAMKPDSPVLQQVGAERGGKAKVKHKKVMLSLDKTKSVQDILDWAHETKATQFVIMPKFDGVSLSVHYEHGKLIQAVTRGDGRIGDDVTKVAKRFVPSSTLLIGKVELRGEVVFSRSAWGLLEEHFKSTSAKGISNPRNAAAGTLLRKSINDNIAKKLRFLCYDVLGSEASRLSNVLKDSDYVFAASPATLRQKIKDIRAWVKTPEFPYETDGLVIKVNAYDVRDQLGETSHHPKWAIALKHEDEIVETTIKDIEWQVSRQGTITPVALLEPTLCGGVTISRATLHHAGHVKSLQLTRGSRVALSRRGGVIPHVERVTWSPVARMIDPPLYCPCCKARTKMRDDFLFCTNDECPDKMRGKLVYWCQQTDMMGFGEKIVYDLYNDGVVWQPADFYALDKDTMVALFGKGLGPKLIKEAAEKAKLTPAVLLTALGIDGIGKTQAEKLFEAMDFDKMMHHFVNDDDMWIIDQLPEGFGSVLTRNLLAGLKQNLGLIQSLVDVVEIVKPAKSSVTKGPFAGKKVVFTGALSDMPREVAQEQVRIFGGTTPNSLTKDTNYLVVGSRASPEQLSKRNKAETYNQRGGKINVIDEETFLELIVDATKAVDGGE